MRDDDENWDGNNSWPPPKRPPPQENEKRRRVMGILLFGLIGAVATTYAVGELRRTVHWFYAQYTRSQSSGKGTNAGFFRSSFQEAAWKRYKRKMQEEYEEEMERVERIRRMQSIFNRERNKYKKSYERSRENDYSAYHQHFEQDDWYWKTDTSHKNWRTNSGETVRDSARYPLSHHYSVLGLDRSRAKPYTEAEIKTAFRAKAMEFHPDQNQDNKDAAEAKFKEVMMSYEAIKLERKNMESS